MSSSTKVAIIVVAIFVGIPLLINFGSFIFPLILVGGIIFAITCLNPSGAWRGAAGELMFNYQPEQGSPGRINGARRGISVTVVPVTVDTPNGKAKFTEYRAFFRPGSFEFHFVIAMDGVDPNTMMPPYTPNNTELPRNARFFTDAPTALTRFFNDINTPVISRVFYSFPYAIITDRGILVRTEGYEGNKEQLVKTVQSLIRSGDILDDRTDRMAPASVQNQAYFAPESTPEQLPLDAIIAAAATPPSKPKFDPIPPPEVEKAIFEVPAVESTSRLNIKHTPIPPISTVEEIEIAMPDLEVSAVPELAEVDLTITPLGDIQPLEEAVRPLATMPEVGSSKTETETAPDTAVIDPGLSIDTFIKLFFGSDSPDNITLLEHRDQIIGKAFDFTGVPEQAASTFRVGKGSARTFTFTVAELENKYGMKMPVRMVAYLPAEVGDISSMVGQNIRFRASFQDVEPLIRTLHVNMIDIPEII